MSIQFSFKLSYKWSKPSIDKVNSVTDKHYKKSLESDKYIQQTDYQCCSCGQASLLKLLLNFMYINKLFIV